MHACEAAGIADLSRWYALPQWTQDLWLAHAFCRVTGRYEAPVRQKPTGSPTLSPDILAEINRQRGTP